MALDGILCKFLRQVSGVGKTFLVKSTDFYRQILGISAPWKIVNVELDMEAKRVVITAKVDRATKWAHPETKQRHPCTSERRGLGGTWTPASLKRSSMQMSPV
jgi:hypothetical protein